MQRLGPLAARLRVSAQPIAQQQRRGFAGHAGEEAKVNMWEAPTDIGAWKEEHIVLTVLACWGVGIFSATKIFGGKGAEPEAAK